MFIVTYFEPTYGSRTFKTADLAKDIVWLDAGGYAYSFRAMASS